MDNNEKKVKEVSIEYSVPIKLIQLIDYCKHMTKEQVELITKVAKNFVPHVKYDLLTDAKLVLDILSKLTDKQKELALNKIDEIKAERKL